MRISSFNRLSSSFLCSRKTRSKWRRCSTSSLAISRSLSFTNLASCVSLKCSNFSYSRLIAASRRSTCSRARSVMSADISPASSPPAAILVPAPMPVKGRCEPPVTLPFFPLPLPVPFKSKSGSSSLVFRRFVPFLPLPSAPPRVFEIAGTSSNSKPNGGPSSR